MTILQILAKFAKTFDCLQVQIHSISDYIHTSSAENTTLISPSTTLISPSTTLISPSCKFSEN